MDKNILYVARQFDKDYLQKLSILAPNFQIIGLNNLLATDYPKVEIMFGWPEHALEIVNSPNSQLKWIQTISAGVDQLPLALLQKRGILVSNGSGIHAIPIAESVLAMLLANYRGIQEAILAQTKATWLDIRGLEELFGKKMLIIGTGQIGQRLADIMLPLGVDIAGVNRTGHFPKPFKTIYTLSQVTSALCDYDIIVNILPLTKETTHYYNEAFFDKVKPGSLFINVGRGPSVKQEALVSALTTGQLAFAAIDVCDPEPLPATSELWQLDNLLITPHISGQTNYYNTRLQAIFEPNLASYLFNRQLVKNQVDLTLGY